MTLLTSFIGLSFLIIVAVWISLSKRDSVSHADKIRIAKQWQHVVSLQDPEKQILEADKVVHTLLKSMGYQGSFGEILKKSGARFSCLDALWAAHKLRNRIAHEPGIQISRKEAKRALATFEKFIASYV